jgi:hypothetical protein
MDANTRPTLPPALRDLAAMAALLERLDVNPHGSASAAQYQVVARRVSALLAEAEPGPALEMLLQAAPATAALYENLQYAHAGLVRSPLEAALNAELAATAAIAKARRG